MAADTTYRTNAPLGMFADGPIDMFVGGRSLPISR